MRTKTIEQLRADLQRTITTRNEAQRASDAATRAWNDAAAVYASRTKLDRDVRHKRLLALDAHIASVRALHALADAKADHAWAVQALEAAEGASDVVALDGAADALEAVLAERARAEEACAAAERARVAAVGKVEQCLARIGDARTALVERRQCAGVATLWSNHARGAEAIDMSAEELLAQLRAGLVLSDTAPVRETPEEHEKSLESILRERAELALAHHEEQTQLAKEKREAEERRRARDEAKRRVDEEDRQKWQAQIAEERARLERGANLPVASLNEEPPHAEPARGWRQP